MQQGPLALALTSDLTMTSPPPSPPRSVSECCATPYSLLGLTFVVSYLALGLLNLCKFYLGGHAAMLNENVMHR